VSLHKATLQEKYRKKAAFITKQNDHTAKPNGTKKKQKIQKENLDSWSFISV